MFERSVRLQPNLDKINFFGRQSLPITVRSAPAQAAHGLCNMSYHDRNFVPMSTFGKIFDEACFRFSGVCFSQFRCWLDHHVWKVFAKY